MDFNQTVFSLARDGKITFLKYMFEKSLKADINRYINAVIDGQTILLIAIKNNHYELVKYLVEDVKVDLEQTGTIQFDGESIENASPLWLAAATSNLPLVQLLVENGANVNSTTKTKSTPLRAACYDGNLAVVKYLVSQGADIEFSNRHGHTCTMIASFKNHLDVVKFLVEDCKADVNKRSIKGNTALHDCAETGSIEIFKVLLENGAKMTEDSCKITPLLTAALNACEAIVHLIILYDVDELTGRVDESRSLCTEIEKIHALELLGSTLVDKKRDISNGIYYWKFAFRRRLKNIARVQAGIDVREGETVEMYKKKIAKPNAAYNYSQEFNSLDEFAQISANVDDIRMQSLLVRERILGHHSDTCYYIRFRGAVYADSGAFDMCIKLWLYALDKQQSTLDPLSPLTQSSLFSFAELFSHMMSQKADLVSFEQIFAVFKRALFELKSAIIFLPNKKLVKKNQQLNKMKLLQTISGVNELRDDDCLNDEMIRKIVESNIDVDFFQSNDQLIKQNGDNRQSTTKDNNSLELKDDLESINFHRILILLLIFIGLLCRLKSIITNDQLFRFKKAVYQLVKINPKGNNGYNLLHQASLRDESCQLIKFPTCEIPTNEIVEILIECGADINEFDNHNNTPLHIVCKNRPNNSAIKMLIDKGAHLDVRNDNGHSPLDYLLENPKFLDDNHIHPIKHLSQCLCAQAISKYKIDYKNILSKEVCEFVQIH